MLVDWITKLLQFFFATVPSQVFVGFQQAEYTFSEGNSSASVCLIIDGSTTVGGIEIEIAINITTTDATAGLCSDM